MGALTLRGVNGSIRWSYHLAATLGAWSVTPQPGGSFTLSASIVTANTSQLAQRPLTFIVPVKTGTWTWPIRELTITGTTLRAILGPAGNTETTSKGAYEQQNAAAGDGQAGD